ncbi:MAG TPA: HIT domain-containing protein [Bacteroidota bacterium]|nr:HIT domain-containing protein [Bacteroidota bacterium]
MQRLFSPWRSKYIDTFSSPGRGKRACILCAAHRDHKDDEHLIVTRGEKAYVLLNLFPYNSGHVMVVPYRHVPALTDLSEEESSEVMQLMKRMTIALQSVSQPDGFNIGSNIGRVAGAGIADHVHFHVVPRWTGDTNFMPVLADTKMISVDLKETLLKLRKALKARARR